MLVNGLNATAAAPLQTKVALLPPGQASNKRLLDLRSEGFTGIALLVTETNVSAAETTTLTDIANAGLQLDYWIEIARNPALADKHPEWMASIQTHQEWRRLYPEFGPTPSNAMVKVYPWVPVLYQESFPAHLDRVTQLLRNRPAPRRLFLNDLQGAPSACGCGNSLCRWTTDYGRLRSATRLPDDAAAQFVAAAKRALPGVQVVPVWTTECEEHDHDGACGGVNCFNGTCWREWTAQLEPVAAQNDAVGVLLLDRVFQRHPPVDGPSASWITNALTFFQQLPLRYHAAGLPTRRLLPVIEGWDLTRAELDLKVARVAEAGSTGIVVALTPIDQSWTPVKFALPAVAQSPVR